MIHFKRIRWKNLLSTGNEWTELQLDARKTTLVVGDNGSGKSTLLDAVTYALFGKPFRRVNKPELINRVNGRELMVQLEFRIDRHEYAITRGARPNVFEVYEDDKLLNQSADIRDYQDVLEKQILKINYKSFCQVVILGSAAFVPFMQLPTGSRREVVEDLLDLQIFSVMNTLLKGKIAENERSVSLLEQERRFVEEKIRLIEQHRAEMDDSVERIISEKRAQVFDAYKKVEELTPRIDALREERDTLLASTEGKHEEAYERERTLDRLMVKLESKHRSHSNDMKFFQESDVCPVCTQEITEELREAKILEKTEKIAEVGSAVKEIQRRLDQVQKEKREIALIKKREIELKDELAKLTAHKRSYDDLATMLTKECDELRERSREQQGPVENVWEVKARLEEIRTEHYELVEDRKVHSVAVSMLRDTGIKARIIAQYVPIINKLINKYLASLDFVCNFTLNENFEERIRSIGLEDASYNSLSEGERFRINIAILFTWRAIAKMRNNTSTNLLILDEIFDSSLDLAGTDEFMKMLGELTEDNNVFVISHKTDTLVDKFSATIKFEKHHGFSKMHEAV